MNKHNEQLGIWLWGINLVRRIRFPIKLGLLAGVVLIPLLITSAALVESAHTRAAITQSETQGMQLMRPLMRVLTLVQKHRGQANMLLSGRTAIQPELDQTRQALGQALSDVDAALGRVQGLRLPAPWQPLADRIKRLGADTASATAPASFALHSDLVNDLAQWAFGVSESSGLRFEFEADSALLLDMAFGRIIPTLELLGQLRGAGAGVLAQPTPDPLAHAALRARLAALESDIKSWQFHLGALRRHDPSDYGGDAALAAARNFAQQGASVFTGAAGGDAMAYFGAGTQALDAFLTLQNRMTEHVQTHLDERSRRLTWMRNALILGTTACLLTLAYLMVCFYKGFMVDLRRLSYAMNELALGNLRVVGTVRSEDEIGDLARYLQKMTTSVSTMVAAVSSNSVLVAHAGRELSAGNRDLSDRTEQQAANLEQTSASVQELASTVTHNAETARNVDRQAGALRTIAETGAQSMQLSVDAVEAIQKSAHRMNEIIGVIDGLAFQTNILALNAAVEAARAGESGRGFAVVASEVRSLAQRSAENAREIRTLIQSSSAQVETSVRQIREAGQSMQHIVTGIHGVSTGVSEISASSAEQATRLTEVSSAVRQLDEITQSNAQMVERAVVQSGGLEGRASSLADAIGGFRLQQGVASEAIALVERALAFRRQVGSRDAFLRGLTDPANGFFDRDMYVFVLSDDGQYLAFAGNPGKVGTSLYDIPGIDANALMSDLLAQTAIGPGWTEYDIVNPTSGVTQAKMSYVMALDNFHIGCGVYKALV